MTFKPSNTSTTTTADLAKQATPSTTTADDLDNAKGPTITSNEVNGFGTGIIKDTGNTDTRIKTKTTTTTITTTAVVDIINEKDQTHL